MKLQLKARALTAALAATTVVVILLAGLQYRWSREVSDATGMRLADTLQLSLINWHLDFLRNFSEICLTMREDPEEGGTGNLNQYGSRLAEWRALARYPALVRDVHVLMPLSPEASAKAGTGPRGFAARRLNMSTREFERVDLPEQFRLWVDVLARSTPGQTRAASTFTGDAVRGWLFEPDAPALLHRAGTGWIVVGLDADVIRHRVLPDLAHRYFQGTDGLDYLVAVVAGQRPRQVLYSSDAGFGQDDVIDMDGTLNVFGRSLSEAFPSSLRVFHRTSDHIGPSALTDVSWFPRLREVPADRDWRLVVQHRRGGPLGAFVADTHRRNMAVSFGALALLVVSMGMLVAASIRAQRLARLQLDFVTAVSHELRTPLTVIDSAADNIVQGVVHGQEQYAQYGAVIGKQVRQLSTLVEEILLFAATTHNQARLVLRPLEVSHIIDATLGSTEELIRAAQFTVERNVARDLPMVFVDLVAVSQLLQNLITNALKYGREHHWLGIRAALVEQGLTGREVQISISDRGMGISASDLPRIFEPFYRSQSATAAQISGTGLGLTLAKRMAEAMKGQLSVNSEPGCGSTFTLHLPCVDEASGQAAVELSAPTAQID